MSDFVRDSKDVPKGKQDAHPLVGSVSQSLTAADWNTAVAALYDLRDAIKELVVDARNYGAKGDGVTDDTAAIAAAQRASPVVYLPSGAYLCNISVLQSGGRIFGDAASGGSTGTRILPYDKAIPAIAVGNGAVAAPDGITLENLVLVGDETTATSDGLKINGASNVVLRNIHARNFGRHNVWITSTADRSTSNAFISELVSKGARGSCLKVDYGTGSGSRTTAIFVCNFTLAGHPGPGARAIDLATASLAMTNGWVRCGGNGQGNIYIDPSAADPKPILFLNSVHVDSDNVEDVLLEINTDKALVLSYVQGLFTVAGACRWCDSMSTNLVGKSGHLGDFTVLGNPHVANRLNFGRKDAGTDQEDIGGDTFLYRLGDVPKIALALSSNWAFRPLATREYPLQMGDGGAVWRDAEGMLRFTNRHCWPKEDKEGWRFGMQVGVPANATAAGKPGQWAVDGDYLYVCTENNTWKRVAISAW